MHLTNQIEASKDNFLKLMTEYPKGEPVVMVNILKYKDKSGIDEETGKETYTRYMNNVTPLLQKAGGQLIWAGNTKFTIVGDIDEQPDAFLIVRYPNIEAFVSMATSPEYRAIANDRIISLKYGGLIASTTFAGQYITI